MTARILTFRRPLSPVPEHIERKPDDLIAALRDADALLDEIRQERMREFTLEMDRMYTSPEKPGA